MRLIIVTGQEGTDVENLLRRIISENKYIYDDAPKMVFPERSSLLYHPSTSLRASLKTSNTPLIY